MLKEQIIASIITFNPDIDRLMENIKSIYNQVDTIIIIDNGSNNIKSITNLFTKVLDVNFDFIFNNENEGIAYALNQALNYAFNKGYKWLLTLDQDSICDKKIIAEFRNFITDNGGGSDVGVVAPRIIDRNINYSKKSTIYRNIENADTVITSGSLTNVEIAKKIGGFIDELFIDGVDFEFCLNLRANNYEIYKINSAKLYHELGKIKVNNILGVKLITTNHSAVRRYYYFRNKIYIYRKYFRKFPTWVMRSFLSNVKTFIFIILFEEQKIKKIKYSIKGIKDGIRGKYGVYTKMD